MNRLDKKLRIYVIDDGIDSEGNSIQIKHYLNTDDSPANMFKCYFRSMSTDERRQQFELGNDCDAFFEINRREVDTNCYIEFTRELFGLKTFKINMIDAYNDNNRTRLRIRAKEVAPKTFSQVKWGGEL